MIPRRRHSDRCAALMELYAWQISCPARSPQGATQPSTVTGAAAGTVTTNGCASHRRTTDAQSERVHEKRGTARCDAPELPAPWLPSTVGYTPSHSGWPAFRYLSKPRTALFSLVKTIQAACPCAETDHASSSEAHIRAYLRSQRSAASNRPDEDRLPPRCQALLTGPATRGSPAGHKKLTQTRRCHPWEMSRRRRRDPLAR